MCSVFDCYVVNLLCCASKNIVGVDAGPSANAWTNDYVALFGQRVFTFINVALLDLSGPSKWPCKDN